MQEGSQEERQVLQRGRGEGDEHGWQQLVSFYLDICCDRDMLTIS